MDSPDRLIALLRRATSTRHEAIERQLGLGAPVGREHYHDVLRAFEAFLSRWEPAVLAALPIEARASAASRCRGHLARRDLEAMGIARAPSGLAVSVPLGSEAAAFGSLYVIEGSALGSVVIARSLARDHGIGPSNGGAYFAGAGAGTAANWRAFQQDLAAAEALGLDAGAACEAARQTFDALGETFRRVCGQHSLA